MTCEQRALRRTAALVRDRRGIAMRRDIARSALFAVALATLLSGCVPPPPGGPRCTTALGPPVLVFNLFFGRTVPGRGDLSDAEWHDFLNRVVTPNLPNGYTVLDANGAWMNPITKKTIQERTKLLLV